MAVHPELGTLQDFRRFVKYANRLGLDVALDIAFQCSPDHPLIAEHPTWFKHRPDGTIAYAENPPKKYEDVVPFDFDTPDWEALWHEMRDTFLFWVEQGVTIFRVDNPHTKPYRFWEWLLADVKERHPQTIFLAEAFTRPALLHGLAKLGFSQSYNYFPWRNTKQDIEEYLRELSHGPGREYLRPSLWANTPDILHEYLQSGGRPAFMARLVLAATLGASYGIYGPAFELCANTPREPGSEEYLDSEKYEIKAWDLDAEWSLRHAMAALNGIRHEHPALTQAWNVTFLPTENDQLIAYVKYTENREDAIVTVVNLDARYQQSGHVTIDLSLLGLEPGRPFEVQDLFGGGRYSWHGARNYVALDPGNAHVLAAVRPGTASSEAGIEADAETEHSA
jgi:starch synthase (maltosyl-transferring)